MAPVRRGELFMTATPGGPQIQINVGATRGKLSEVQKRLRCCRGAPSLWACVPCLDVLWVAE